MADLCLPLSAGEDTFELHSVLLEAVERQIHELLGKQAQLRKRKAMLETSRADAHKSGVSMQRAANTPTTSTPCVSLHRPQLHRDFTIHVDNTNDALGLAFTDLINSFGVKQNVTGPTHRFNHTPDLIISHGIDLTDIDIVPQSDDVTDHLLVSCMLHITDINYMAPRYRPGRIIVPATKDRFTNRHNY